MKNFSSDWFNYGSVQRTNILIWITSLQPPKQRNHAISNSCTNWWMEISGSFQILELRTLTDSKVTRMQRRYAVLSLNTYCVIMTLLQQYSSLQTKEKTPDAAIFPPYRPGSEQILPKKIFCVIKAKYVWQFRHQICVCVKYDLVCFDI